LEEVLKIINPMTSTIFWSIVVFVLLFIALWRFALKPIDKVISKRQLEIRENINNAEKQREETKRYLEEQKRQLEKAMEKARKIIEGSKTEAQKLSDEIEKKAHQRARAMIERALAEIRTEKERSIDEVRNRIVEIALIATEKMIAKSLSEEEHKKLIEESLKEIEKI